MSAKPCTGRARIDSRRPSAGRARAAADALAACPPRRAAVRLASVVLVSVLLAAAPLAAAPASAVLVLHADLLHRVSAGPLRDAVVIVRDGRIAAVGRRGELRGPPDARVLEARVVTPGLIDTDTTAGLSGMLNARDDSEQDETSAPVQAALRAIDAFDPREPLLRYLLSYGVTVVQSGPGPRAPIAGQAGIFRTWGTDVEAMTLRFPSAQVFNMGAWPKQAFAGQREFPSTRMGVAALFREKLFEARHPRGGRGLPGFRRSRAPGEEALGPVVRGERIAIFRAHRAHDITTALRIVREYGLRARIAGATEAYLVRDALREAGVPVLVGPVTKDPLSLERLHASFENAALLADAGIDLAIRSGYEPYVPKTRIVLFEAAIAAANGLGSEAALRAITLDAARLLGIDDDFGSVEAGKVADLVLFDGDPFEYTSHVEAVLVAGEVVHERGAGSPGAAPAAGPPPLPRPDRAAPAAPGGSRRSGPRSEAPVRRSAASTATAAVRAPARSCQGRPAASSRDCASSRR